MLAVFGSGLLGCSWSLTIRGNVTHSTFAARYMRAHASFGDLSASHFRSMRRPHFEHLPADHSNLRAGISDDFPAGPW